MSQVTDDNRGIGPVPRVEMHAFYEMAGVAEILEQIPRDRRMQNTQVRVVNGGGAAAGETYKDQPTPNVIILESSDDRAALLASLDGLAEVCDAGTKVLVIGHVNDVLLYRELTRRGVSDYLIAPIRPLDVIQAISELFHAPGATPIGKTIAVVGAKGGVGASTVAHNLAWAIARRLETPTVIVDLDIAFGTAGLDFNQDPPQGIAEAVVAPDRLASEVLQGLFSRCSDNLSLLAAPAVLDRTADLTESALDGLIDILRGMIPNIVLDVPPLWTAWAK